jgi:hypothetical protein
MVRKNVSPTYISTWPLVPFAVGRSDSHGGGEDGEAYIERSGKDDGMICVCMSIRYNDCPLLCAGRETGLGTPQLLQQSSLDGDILPIGLHFERPPLDLEIYNINDFCVGKYDYALLDVENGELRV